MPCGKERGLSDPSPPKPALRVVTVASLRVDAVGAKGFGLSRTYFAQGVKQGKVTINGKVVDAKDQVKEGDVLVADGLGSLKLVRVLGATRRGNHKLEVEVYSGFSPRVR